MMRNTKNLKVGDLVKASYGFHATGSIGIVIEVESDLCKVAWTCQKRGQVFYMEETHSYTGIYRPENS